MVLIDGHNVHTRREYNHQHSKNDSHHLVKPSDLIGSVKRSLGRRPKCQCKHHQQKLLQKQEEQRQKLREQILSQQNTCNYQQQDQQQFIHLQSAISHSSTYGENKISSSKQIRALKTIYGRLWF